MTQRKNIAKWTGLGVLVAFVLMNVFAYFHARKFTHFTQQSVERTKDPGQLSTGAKLKALFLGVNNPRPVNGTIPARSYETITLEGNKQIECWYLNVQEARGTVILFHGYRGCKASLLERARLFREMGYNTLLVDFMGSGGSEGNETTIGFKEARQVKTCFDYIAEQGADRIYLFGSSMGAAAIMRVAKVYDVSPYGVMLECPFGTMYKTVCARFDEMDMPAFPMADLLVFWGGVQQGFWAFGHNPVQYAKSINCPALLMYGKHDKKVSRQEINGIYSNLPEQRELVIFEKAGHANYLETSKQKWQAEVREFLTK